MKKRMVLCVLLLMMFLLSACNGNAVEEQAAEQDTVTIVDHAGRRVVIEGEPETIISGYYITTSMLIALDQDEKLVAIENDGDKRPVYGMSSPGLLELPGIGTVKEFDLESCAALNPDLVILPYKLKNMADSLEELEIPVIFVQPETQELLNETIEMIGKATNSQPKAKELQQYMNKCLDDLENALEDVEVPSVYMAGNSSLLSTAGPAMYQHSLIENAKGENVAQDLEDTYWAEISYEQLLAWNPEYIILAADANYTVESVLEDVNLQDCDAVKNKNVYQIPNEIESWDSPVPGSILGNLWVASVLHPEAYETAQYEEAVVDFYETFYGFIPEK